MDPSHGKITVMHGLFWSMTFMNNDISNIKIMFNTFILTKNKNKVDT